MIDYKLYYQINILFILFKIFKIDNLIGNHAAVPLDQTALKLDV